MVLAERISALLGSDAPIHVGQPRTGEVTHYIADITHARTKLGYDPKVPFDDGIVRTVEWYGAHTAAA
jgi:nucleoside-diphosphate-sugar epimerase